MTETHRGFFFRGVEPDHRQLWTDGITGRWLVPVGRASRAGAGDVGAARPGTYVLKDAPDPSLDDDSEWAELRVNA